jgi:hypothetical protein
LNEKILNVLGASWDKPGPFLIPNIDLRTSQDRISEAIVRKWLADSVEALNLSYGKATAIVLKDPRIALFLPLWRAALAQAGFAPQFIVVYRNPLEVAASLRARNGQALRQSLLLWQLYNLKALEPLAAGGCGTIVSYGQLLENPAATLKSAFEDLQVDVKPLQAPEAAALAEFIAPEDCHHAFDSTDVDRAPWCARQVRDMWDLLTGWSAQKESIRGEAIGHLRESFDEAVMLTGAPKRITRQQLDTLDDEALAPPVRPGRRSFATAKPRDANSAPLVLHYHLFKNAGTSVDEILIRNFGSRWATEEFSHSDPGSNVAAVQAYLRDKPDLLALSSHTALLPVPDLGGRRIIPVIFIRHPIDRLKSAYEFERRQAADTLGARLAKKNEFTDYLRELLVNPGNRQARNFQTHRLAFNEPPEKGSEKERALRTLKKLEFIGLVEAFDKSMERLTGLMETHFTNFRRATVKKNATRHATNLDRRLGEIRSEIGDGLYKELIAANATDLEVFNVVSDAYAESALSK